MDIKPSNIMIDKEDYIKIIDFGTSKDLINTTIKQIDGGTLGYCAPEVVRKSPYSYQADLFAVGIIMYRAIEGKFPFTNRIDKN